MRADPYTLFIALDASGRAEGELYLDDEHTHEFQSGNFARRKFTFADGRLTSTAISSTAYSTNAVIERIVIYGLVQEPVGIKATKPGVKVVYQSDSKLPSGQRVSSSCIIRNPRFGVIEDFTVQLSFEK